MTWKGERNRHAMASRGISTAAKGTNIFYTNDLIIHYSHYDIVGEEAFVYDSDGNEVDVLYLDSVVLDYMMDYMPTKINNELEFDDEEVYVFNKEGKKIDTIDLTSLIDEFLHESKLHERTRNR